MADDDDKKTADEGKAKQKKTKEELEAEQQAAKEQLQAILDSSRWAWHVFDINLVQDILFSNFSHDWFLCYWSLLCL